MMNMYLNEPFHTMVAFSDSHMYKVEEISGPLYNLFVKFGFSFNSVKGILEKSWKKSCTEFESTS
jgi:hypothetical protein